ncbi:helix-turn-helix transcriptional regulator [Halobacteriovorax sp. ZH4_bin.1]|uniref:helix-turn-helix domain-containing protein n=1 Tax=unclassified Halobacteriovorax TaxID=2639665 RepID=UPI00371A3FC8
MSKSYEELLSKVANNIKTIRTSKGLTQQNMAEEGFNYRYYQKIESGRQSLNLETLYRISKVLKVDVVDLLK